MSAARRSWRRCAALAAALALGCAGGAHAQSLEGVLMPGPVIQGHAKYESDCRSCHIPFDRAAQNRLCLDCHKEVGADVRDKRGYHGRLAPQPCRACHTDHKGRDAVIVQLDEKKFDHRATDFELRGAHAAPKLECRSCHPPKRKFREAPSTCIGCHRKDDTHKGRLGDNCAQCHNETNWKQAQFDHDKTRFPLRGKHAPVKCVECHRDNRYRDTPVACVACHRKDDTHKDRFGERCEGCHVDQSWPTITFDHDRDTKYPLRGRHRQIKCESCHTSNAYKEKLASDCIACHRKDDKHQGTLGKACGDCHTERAWTVPRFDHDKTKFPLRGKHASEECKSCHKSLRFADVGKTCIDCHRKDDKHKGKLGIACGDCHTDRNWRDSRFDHDRTRFALDGRHRSARCESCHETPEFKKTPSQCFACHRREDKHEGQLGSECADCHNARGWKEAVRFDHARTRFPLVGLHLKVPCAKCHATPRYKDAKSDCYSCHERDDAHKRRLGTLCADCHNARDWKLWDYNHDRRTRFPLDGAHRRIKCEACHKRPVNDKPTLPVACAACHAADDVHEGAYGPLCERCHTTTSFKQIKRRVGAIAFPTALNGVRLPEWWPHANGSRSAPQSALH